MNALFALALLLDTSRTAPDLRALREYWMDAGHSIVEFSIPFAFSRVKGRFQQVKGTVLYDTIAPASSSVSVIIETNSLDTGWPHRDEHLRTSDFFDVEKFPTIEFHSERMRVSDSVWVAEGPLTMHGVTRAVAIPFRFVQRPVFSAESRWVVMVAAASLKLARADFGITGGSTFNSWFSKARAATMGDSVEVNLEVELYSPDQRSQRPPGVDVMLERLRTAGIDSQITRLRDLKATKTPAELQGYFRGQDFVVRGLIADKRLADAEKLARVLTELFPSIHSAWLMHGLTLALSGEARGAEREYAQAKKVFVPPVKDPNEKFPQVDDQWYYLDQLARTAVEWGQARAALGMTRTVAEIYPAQARALATYGLVLAAAGDAKGAAAQLDRALALDPRETRAIEWRRRVGR